MLIIYTYIIYHIPFLAQRSRCIRVQLRSSSTPNSLCKDSPLKTNYNMNQFEHGGTNVPPPHLKKSQRNYF